MGETYAVACAKHRGRGREIRGEGRSAFVDEARVRALRVARAAHRATRMTSPDTRQGSTAKSAFEGSASPSRTSRLRMIAAASSGLASTTDWTYAPSFWRTRRASCARRPAPRPPPRRARHRDLARVGRVDLRLELGDRGNRRRHARVVRQGLRDGLRARAQANVALREIEGDDRRRRGLLMAVDEHGPASAGGARTHVRARVRAPAGRAEAPSRGRAAPSAIVPETMRRRVAARRDQARLRAS